MEISLSDQRVMKTNYPKCVPLLTQPASLTEAPTETDSPDAVQYFAHLEKRIERWYPVTKLPVSWPDPLDYQ